MTDEHVFLDTPGFKVTSARIVAGDTTYALANITSATIKGEPGAHKVAPLVLILGCGAVTLWATDHSILAGAVAVFALAALASSRKPYDLVLTTGSAEQHALRSGDRAVIERASGAVAEAIAYSRRY